MYMSTLLIDVGDNPDRPRPGRLWLKNLYRVHQRLCMAFPAETRKTEDREFLKPYRPEDFARDQVHVPRKTAAGFLYRIDPRPGGNPVILVQSAQQPDWEYAFHNAGYLLAAGPEVKEFNPRFEKEQNLRFRLLANPTKKIDTKTGEDGKKRNGRRVPVPADQLLDWLSRKAEQGGFEIAKELTVCQPAYLYFNKREAEKARLFAVRYDGVLRVTEPENLANAICAGIGPAKGFGFGLLSVARA